MQANFGRFKCACMWECPPIVINSRSNDNCNKPKEVYIHSM